MRDEQNADYVAERNAEYVAVRRGDLCAIVAYFLDLRGKRKVDADVVDRLAIASYAAALQLIDGDT